MSSTTNTNNSTSSSSSTSTYRVNYSDYVADIKSSPRSTRKPITTGIGHHINSPNASPSNRPVQSTGTMPFYGGSSEKCVRCSKTVYHAERRMGAGRPFHSSCFNCRQCKRKLDSATLSEHKGEIFCKGCYTKLYGAHGLVSGVAMTTEHNTGEYRPTRRSSFGSDLDAPVITYEPTRYRSNSTENLLRDDFGVKIQGDTSRTSPRPMDTSYERTSSSSRRTNDFSPVGDRDYRRPSSPIRVEATPGGTRIQVTYSPNSERRQYGSQDDKRSYGTGSSEFVNIPVVVAPKRVDPTINRVEIPTMFNRDNQRNRSRSPSPTISSNDSYRRSNSRERITDITDKYARTTIDDNNRYSNQRSNIRDDAINSTNFRASPASPTNSRTSPFESKYKSSPSTANTYTREQSYERSSSPVAPACEYRSSSPTSGYTSSTTTRTTSSTYREESRREPSSPSSAFTPIRPDYQNIPIKVETRPVERRSPSPTHSDRSSSSFGDVVPKTNTPGTPSSPTQSNRSSSLADFMAKTNFAPTPSSPSQSNRSSSALNEFATKTNIVGTPTSPIGGPTSVLDALVKPRATRIPSIGESNH